MIYFKTVATVIRLQIQTRYHLLKIIRKVSILNIVHKIEMVVTKKLKQKKHKKGKSGITRKSSDQALFEVARSQEFCGNGDLEFDSLSLTALVRGETFIINNIEPKPYAKACAEHLNFCGTICRFKCSKVSSWCSKGDWVWSFHME